MDQEELRRRRREKILQRTGNLGGDQHKTEDSKVDNDLLLEDTTNERIVKTYDINDLIGRAHKDKTTHDSEISTEELRQRRRAKVLQRAGISSEPNLDSELSEIPEKSSKELFLELKKTDAQKVISI